MRNYSATAGAMSLTGGVSASDTSITLDTVVGLPSSFPYSLVLDPGQASEEIVQVSAAAGSTLTVQRGFDGTSAQSHSLGATVRHMMIPMDLREPQQHIAATADVHGVTGRLVGEKQAQVLDRKTFQSTDGSTTPITVQKQTGQTEDLVQFKDESGNVMWSVPSDGGSFVSDGAIIRNGASANFFKRVIDAVCSAVDVVGIRVKGYAGQTADLQQWQKSDGTVLAKVDKSGNLTAANYADSGVLTSGVVTAAPGFTVTLQRARKMGKVAWVYVELTSTNAFAAGDVTNTNIVTLAPGWECDYISGVSNGATGPTWSGYVNSSGEVKITATATGIPAGGPLSFSATYLIP